MIDQEIDRAIRRATGQVNPAQRFGDPEAVLYRGASLAQMNNDEFTDNTINGDNFDVWFADMTTTERDRTKKDSSISVYRTKAVDDGPLAEFVEDHESIPITGGLTDTLGVATNFHVGMRDPVGIILYLDPERIPGNLVQIRYRPDWFDNHPGVMSHVDDLSVGEVHVNGSLWGLVQVNSETGVKYVQEWGDMAREKTTWNRFNTEREVVAQVPEIGLDGATLAVATHYHTASPTGVPIRTALNDLPGYTDFGVGSDTTNTQNMSDRELTETLWGEIADLMEYPSDNYWIVLRDDPRIERDERQVGRDNFLWAYNGDHGFVGDYHSVGLLVGLNRSLDP